MVTIYTYTLMSTIYYNDEWEHSTNKKKGIKAKTKDIKYEQSDLFTFVLFNMLNSSQKFEKSSCLIKN